MRSDRNNLIHPIGSPEQVVVHLPKRPYETAVGQLDKKVSGVEADYDHFGHVRHLTTDCPEGFINVPYNGKPLSHAKKALKLREIRNALGLRYVDLRDGGVDELPSLGYRVWFRQVLRINGQKRAIQVRGGYVHVYLDQNGRVFMINSTLRRGRKPAKLGKVITRKQAIKAALAKHGVSSCDKAKCTLVFSAHEGSIDPIYEVVLSTCEPRKLVLYLVEARTGNVVYAESKLHYTTTAPAAGPAVPARSFLRIPNPSKPIDDQVHDALIESLPDPTVLKNDNLVVYLGRMGQQVKAKADGTFKYTPAEPEFGCVITFIAINTQLSLFQKWGMKKPSRPIPVVVRDRSVRDNAYFDPESVEIHLGVGSGLPRGLNKNIDFDLGVSWHETGHYVVFLQTPGSDLPGSEGGAGHEASGDYCDILLDFWFRLIHGKTMGHELTKDEVDKDPRIIGVYAMPPRGIRQQKNTKRTPRDKTGEVHDDGEIVGGAMCDVLVGLALRPDVDMQASFEYAGRLFLAALALVPAHKVMFKDILRAFVTADQTLAGGANRQLIEKSFEDHGITLGSRITDPDALKKGGKPRRRKTA